VVGHLAAGALLDGDRAVNDVGRDVSGQGQGGGVPQRALSSEGAAATPVCQGREGCTNAARSYWQTEYEPRIGLCDDCLNDYRARDDTPTFTPICDREGCTEPGVECWLPSLGVVEDGQDDEPDEYLCVKHASESGYCWSCGNFWGGIESFEFHPRNLCENCASEEEDDEWDDEDGYDYEAFPINDAPEGAGDRTDQSSTLAATPATNPTEAA
jgi:hypothetical protein